MAPLQLITRAFIDVFGITHPTPEQERTASRFIGTLLAVIAAAMVVFVVIVFKMAHR